MNLINLFRRRSSAPVARDRLQILLAHERSAMGRSDLVDRLREEILAVIAKHLPVDSDKVKVKMERGEAVSTLEVDVEIPIANPARAGVKESEKTETAAEAKADAAA